VIVSNGKNLHLDKGTRLLLVGQPAVRNSIEFSNIGSDRMDTAWSKGRSERPFVMPKIASGLLCYTRYNGFLKSSAHAARSSASQENCFLWTPWRTCTARFLRP